MKVYQLIEMLNDLPKEAEIEIYSEADCGYIWASWEIDEITTDFNFEKERRKARWRRKNQTYNELRAEMGLEPNEEDEKMLEGQVEWEMKNHYSEEEIEKLKNRYLLIAYQKECW